MIAVAVMPFLLGLLGAPILLVMFGPMYRALARHTRPSVAAGVVVAAAVLSVFVPAVAISVLVLAELPSVLAGPGTEQFIAALAAMRVGPFDIGTELASMGGEATAWLSRQAFAVIGGVTFVAINLLIAFFGLYFLLVAPADIWREVGRFLPFSRETIERLRARFYDATHATIIGIGLTALLQGAVVAAAFAIVGLGHPLLWGTVTGVVSVLPVFGSALVWLPGSLVLAVNGRYGAATVLAILGAVVASNIDNVVRPMVFRRISRIHPLITVVGAFAGMRYFGLLGVLLGPLTLLYFIELVRAFEHEHLTTA
jgi:predicted PurR-regulated permease PerM